MTKRNVGRPPKNERASHCCMVRFTDTEFARFLTMFEQSGLQNKAVFIKARVFNETFRVIKVDRSARLLSKTDDFVRTISQCRGEL